MRVSGHGRYKCSINAVCHLANPGQRHLWIYYQKNLFLCQTLWASDNTPTLHYAVPKHLSNSSAKPKSKTRAILTIKVCAGNFHQILPVQSFAVTTSLLNGHQLRVSVSEHSTQESISWPASLPKSLSMTVADGFTQSFYPNSVVTVCVYFIMANTWFSPLLLQLRIPTLWGTCHSVNPAGQMSPLYLTVF